MAKVTALTQGLAINNDHEVAINNLLTMSWVTKVFISVAFVRKEGVKKIESKLRSKNSITNMFVGISNGITSKQALSKLLSIGINPYAIDMGTQSNIFHPKVYAVIGEDKATVILGSANLTAGGLSENVEFSSLIELDLTSSDDEIYISSLISPFDGLNNQYPENIFKITNEIQLDELVNQGRLEDESIRKTASITNSKTPSGQSVATPALPIYRRNKKSKSSPTAIIPSSSSTIQQITSSLPTGLVWSSRELKERDLNIPTSSNTNATGSMYFKKGLLKGIDQRHYFKDVIFSSLSWAPDSKNSKRHLLRATADFEIIINGISNGFFNLLLTHNSKMNTKTYNQNNAMTQIHWGKAKTIISKRGLLNKHMSLYYLGNNKYQIEIT
ncbi:phospholipase D family protein [Proteus hauseri]|nr:phospholipase D family protein [Proteus hauseri]